MLRIVREKAAERSAHALGTKEQALMNLSNGHEDLASCASWFKNKFY